MKKTLATPLAILLTLWFCTCCSKSPVYESSLKELDRTIENQGVLINATEIRIDSLRTALSNALTPALKFDIYDKLYKNFETYNLDSAFFYAHKKEEIAAQSNDINLISMATYDLAMRYISSGIYDGALEVMNALDVSAIAENKRFAYYRIQRRIYHELAATDKDPVRVEQHKRKKQYFNELCHKSSLLSDNDLDAIDQRVNEEITLGRPGIARKIIEEKYSLNAPVLEDKNPYYYWMARTYELESDIDNQILNYAICANLDKKTPGKSSRAMVRLAKLLYQTGDSDRAFKYMTVAYNDATQSDSQIALEEINQLLPQIIESYENMRMHRIRSLYISVAILIPFIIILVVLLTLVYNDRKQIRGMQKKIQQSNDEIKKINSHLVRRIEQLRESNKIKDVYIVRYLFMFLGHIDSLERYRSTIRVTAKSHDINEIQKALRSNEMIDNEREKFFDSFDATFLGLFPDFVKQLNSLLREDCKVGQNLEPLKLSNELRIFALIRLGVTDSATIAKFLKKSPSTIYNYRVKLRNGSICSREEFEKRLMKIGNIA